MPAYAPAPLTPTAPHPQLLQALDELVSRMPPDMQRADGEVHVPAIGGDRENFERAVRGVEHTLAQSPPWPLIRAIQAQIQRLTDALRSPPAEFIVTIQMGHELRVLVRAVHERVRASRVDWPVHVVGHDLLTSLAKCSAANLGRAVHDLWVASDSTYLNPEQHFISAVRAAYGDEEPSTWAFLKEHETSEVKAAVNGVAADIVKGRRPWPESYRAAAAAIVYALAHKGEPAASTDRAAFDVLRGGLARDVALNFPTERTRWPLLRAAAFEVGHIDATWRVVVMRHVDHAADVGPCWTRPEHPSLFRPPAALFGGKAGFARARKTILRWFLESRRTLGLDGLDALFVCPVRTDDPDVEAIVGAWSEQDREGVAQQLKMNITIHKDALGLGTGNKIDVAARPSWERMRVSDNGGQVFVDGVPHRLIGSYDGPFLTKLIAAKGEPLKGTALERSIGERPDRIYPRLPPVVRDLVDRPGQGRSGWRLR